MTKSDIAIKVYEKRGNPLICKEEVKRIVNATIDEISKAIIQKGSLKISGFGRFEVKKKKERYGHNPQTQERIIIPEKTYVSFKAGKDLLEAIEKEEYMKNGKK